MNKKIIIYSYKIIFIIIIKMLLITQAKAQNEWAYTYGSNNNEKPYCAIQSNNGDYIAAGLTNSFGSGGYDYWIIRVNNTGNILWQQSFGTSQADIAYKVYETVDGSIILAGETSIINPPENDILVVKTNSVGVPQWQRIYRSGFASNFGDIKETLDNGYIIAANTLANASSSNGIWIIKLNNNGNVAWNNIYKSEYNDYAHSIQQTSDTGYIVAGDISYLYNWTGVTDMWVIKLTSAGGVSWQRSYGWTISETSYEHAYSIQQTTDAGYIVAGSTESYGAGNTDMWVLKLNSSGNVTWQRTYGGIMNDVAYSIQQTSDGGYILAGYTESVEINNRDAIIIKLDSSGNIVWQKRYGGPYFDEAQSIKQTNDGGFIIAIDTYSYGSGFNDFLLLKTNANGEIDPTCTLIKSANLTTSTPILTPAIPSYESYSIPIYTYTPSIINLPTTANEINICSSSPGAVPDNDNYAGTPLTISKEGTSMLKLSWGAPPPPCITTNYSIYRGSLPFINYNHSYLFCSTGNSTTYTIPADEQSYYYLVVAQYGNLEGSYGVDSNNNQRPIGTSSCYSQHIASCNSGGLSP